MVKKIVKKPTLIEEEASQPAEEVRGEEDFFENACVSCRHPANMHFEGKFRQCNSSGCACVKYSI